MATNWPRIPALNDPRELQEPLPTGWRLAQIESLFEQLPVGRRFDKKSTSPQGLVPVIDQSESGTIGWHDEEPGVSASPDRPVVTFANHTCEMRWMQRAFSVIQNVFPLTGKPGVCDTRFLYYGTKGRVHTEEYKGHFPDYRRKWIALPPMEEQRRIAHVLGVLDDKIELNRRMSETLDQMSQAIYQAWFQAFAPEMDLPHGWRRAPLSEFFDLGIGGAWGEESRTDKATISVHSLRGIDCHNLAEVQLPDVPVRWISERQLKSRNITTGTILIEGSGSFCGRSLVWTESYNRLFEQPVVYSNFVKRLSPKVDSAQAIVAAFGLREAYRKGVVQAYRTGTAFPNLDVKGLLASLEVVVPTAEVAQHFVEIYSPERRVLTLLENNTLRQLRDTLLPKLLTGEIRVLEAEQLVSEVA